MDPSATPTPTPPRIGQPWPGQGGIYAGIIRGDAGQPDYHLICAATDAPGEHQFGGYGTQIIGCESDLDGAANTAALLAADSTHPAVEAATQFTADGHPDFYLPSRQELRLVYVNVANDGFTKDDYYWTSTQDSAHYAWVQDFYDGSQYWLIKDGTARVRPVRRFPV